MIDGGRTVAKIAGLDICLYESMRDLALQFAHGGMTIDEYLDTLEYMALTAGEEIQS